MRIARKSFFNVSLGSILTASSFGCLEAAKLSDVINNATIQGFAFGRVQTIHGPNGEGTRYQFRFKPTITSGEVYGVSASAGIFFSKGSSTPDSNSSDNDIGGSRGQTIDSATDRFNIGDFYVTYNAAEAFGSKSKIYIGQKSPGTPFSDNNLDRALGVFIENNDMEQINFGFQWWDSWMGDDMYLSIPDINSTGAGIGNNMFMAYVKSGDAFTKETGLSYNLWYGGIHRWVNAMIFADATYTMGFDNQSLTITAQTAFTQISNNVFIYSKSPGLKGLGWGPNEDKFAKNRGMYNIRVDYKYNFTESSNEEDGDKSKAVGYFSAAAGISGSYGDGFGALIDNIGGLKLGWHLWYSFSGMEANGFGILGVGSFKNSSIVVPYLKAEMGYKKASVVLDLAYINASHFFFLKKGASGTNLNDAPDILYGGSNYVKAASFFDITLSGTYKLTDNINVLATYGYAFGNPQLGRFRFQVNYVF